MASRPGNTDNEAIREIAYTNKELVKLNQEAGKQTNLMIYLTIIITILTFIMSYSVLSNI